MMRTNFLRGLCVGAIAGMAVETLMLCGDCSTRTRAGDTMRAMGNAVDDAVDTISHKLR